MNRRVVSWSAAVGLLLGCGAAWAQQGNLHLNGCDVDMRQFESADWSLTKNLEVYDPQTGYAVWRVNANKSGGSTAPLTVDGFVRLKNTGRGNATVGNIVVNLQALRLVSGCWQWQTVTSNVSDGTLGDGATCAVLCPGASSEGLGQFCENAGSGTLQFTDRDTNAVFSLVPRATITPGDSVPLLYTATFSPFSVGVQPGELVRVELLVTFGNAREQGGHGSLCENIDMSGDGALQPDEADVRTVACRSVRTIPSLRRVCNDEVVLTDLGPATTGTVTYDLFSDNGLSAGVTINNSAEFLVVATGVNGGAEGGTFCNTVTLTSAGEDIDLNDDTHEDGCRRRFRFNVCPPVSLTASNCIDVDTQGDDGFIDGDYLTYTQLEYGVGGLGETVLVDNYETVFAPNGLEIGDYEPSNGNAAPNGALWEANATGLTALQTYVGTVGFGDTPITADVFNAPSFGSVLSRQVTGLTLNVALNDNNLLYCTAPGAPAFGDLYYCNAFDSGDSLNGLTVRQILATANNALAYGAGALPAGYSFNTLRLVVTDLNGAFDGCTVSTFATDNLRRDPCP